MYFVFLLATADICCCQGVRVQSHWSIWTKGRIMELLNCVQYIRNMSLPRKKGFINFLRYKNTSNIIIKDLKTKYVSTCLLTSRLPVFMSPTHLLAHASLSKTLTQGP